MNRNTTLARHSIVPATLTLATALALTGCGASGGSKAKASSEYKAVVLTVGTATDGAFGNAWSNAVKKASGHSGAKVDWVGDLNAPNQYVTQGGSYASAGYNLVVVAHGGMLPAAEQLAKQFPKTQFCVAPVPDVDVSKLPKNLCVVDVRQEVGAFRAGVLAGLVTKSNVVASNQAFPFPAISRQISAYALGARCVNAKVKVINDLTNNDSDPSLTKTASESQIKKGADVLFGATGTAMSGMFEAAKQANGVRAIGQYVDSTAAAPSVVLATTILNVEDVLVAMIKDAKAGKLAPYQAYGLNGPVDVGFLVLNDALFKGLSADQQSRYKTVEGQITDGKIKIPDTSALIANGAGDSIDVHGLGCNPA